MTHERKRSMRRNLSKDSRESRAVIIHLWTKGGESGVCPTANEAEDLDQYFLLSRKLATAAYSRKKPMNIRNNACRPAKRNW